MKQLPQTTPPKPKYSAPRMATLKRMLTKKPQGGIKPYGG